MSRVVDRLQVRTPDGFVLRTGGCRKRFLILRKRKPENHAAVNQLDCVKTMPAKSAPRDPIDLIPKDIRNRYPEQTRCNQQVSKHREQQAARFVTQKGRIKQRFGCEQTENPESAYREKFIHEKKREEVADGA